MYVYIQLTPDNSNFQGKSEKVRVIGSSNYREMATNDWKLGDKTVFFFFHMLIYYVTVCVLITEKKSKNETILC